MGRQWKPYRTSTHNPVITSYQPVWDEGKRPSGHPFNPFDVLPNQRNPDPWDLHIVIHSNAPVVQKHITYKTSPLGLKHKVISYRKTGQRYRPGLPLGHPTQIRLPHFHSRKEHRWLDKPLHPRAYKGTPESSNNNPNRRIAKVALAKHLFFPTAPPRNDIERAQQVGLAGAHIRDLNHNEHFRKYYEQKDLPPRVYQLSKRTAEGRPYNISLHSPDYRQCEANARTTGQRCRRRALIGDRRCAKHTNRRMWVDVAAGRYSAYLPKDLAQRLSELIDDPEILNLSAELGLTTIRIEQLLEATKQKSAGYSVFKELREVWREIELSGLASGSSNQFSEKALGDSPQGSQGGSSAAQFLLPRLGRLIEEGAREGATWLEITQQIEQRRKLAESEGRRMERMQQMLPTDKVLILVEFISNSVKKALQDNVANNTQLPAFEANDATERALEQIAADIRFAISGESGGQPLTPSYVKPPTAREQLGDVAPHPLPKVPPKTSHPRPA